MQIAEAYVKIRPDTAGFAGDLTGQVQGQTDRAATTASQSFGRRFSAGLKGMGSSIAAQLSSSAGLVAGLAGVAAGLRYVIGEYEEAAAIGRRTEAVIESTGGVAGITAGHLEELAGKLSKVAAVDDDLIQSAGNVLLTFKAVRNEVGRGNDVFDRTLTAATDMSAALGTDLQSAVMQLGKAIQNPVTGMSRLQRAGVDFTEQQKAQVQALVASGNTLEAQKVILAEVEAQFGGAAEASATGLARMQVAFGNLAETIGGFGPLQDWFQWWVDGISDPLDRIASYASFSPLGAVWDAMAPPPNAEKAVGEVFDRFSAGARDAAGAADGFAGSLADLSEAVKEYLDLTYDLPSAQRGLAEAFQALRDSDPADIAENLQGVAEAFGEVISAGGDPLGSLGVLMGGLRQLREEGDITQADFEGLREVLRGMPGVTEPLTARVEARGIEEARRSVGSWAQQILEVPPSRETAFEAKTEAAERAAEGYAHVVNGVPDGRITTYRAEGQGSAVAAAINVQNAIRGIDTDVTITFRAITVGVDAAAAAIRGVQQSTPNPRFGGLVSPGPGGAAAAGVPISVIGPSPEVMRAAASYGGRGTTVVPVSLDGRVIAEVVAHHDHRTGVAEGFEQ